MVLIYPAKHFTPLRVPVLAKGGDYGDQACMRPVFQRHGKYGKNRCHLCGDAGGAVGRPLGAAAVHQACGTGAGLCVCRHGSGGGGYTHLRGKAA